jgi:hypothetical protein
MQEQAAALAEMVSIFKLDANHGGRGSGQACLAQARRGCPPPRP